MESFLAPSWISVWFTILASTPASTISTSVTHKTYKVSTSGTQAFSSHSYLSGPSSRSSAFSRWAVATGLAWAPI